MKLILKFLIVALSQPYIASANSVEEYLNVIRSSNSSELLVTAIETLRKFPNPVVSAEILSTLQNRSDLDYRSRQAGVYALGEMGDRAAIEYVFAVASPEGWQRESRRGMSDVSSANTALDAFYEKNLVITEVLKDVVRNRAAHTEAQFHVALSVLSKHADTRVTELFASLLDSDDPEYRGLAVLAFGHARDGSRKERLLQILQNDVIQNQILAAGSLGEIGESFAVEPLLSKLKGSRFNSTNNMTEDDYNRRNLVIFLISSLGKLGDRNAISEIRRYVFSRDEMVRHETVRALIALRGDGKWAAALYLRDELGNQCARLLRNGLRRIGVQ